MQLILDNATNLQLPLFERTRDKKIRNALHHLSSGSRYVDIVTVRYLTTIRVGVNDIDDEGYSPLARDLVKFLDRSSHKAEIADHLFRAGAHSSFHTTDGSTLGHLSASADELGIELL